MKDTAFHVDVYVFSMSGLAVAGCEAALLGADPGASVDEFIDALRLSDRGGPNCPLASCRSRAELPPRHDRGGPCRRCACGGHVANTEQPVTATRAHLGAEAVVAV
jgi:hypothetical protein